MANIDQITQPPMNTGLNTVFYAWLVQLIQIINKLAMNVSVPIVTPGPYANDTAAAAAGVAIGKQYYLPSGPVVIRLV